MISSDNTPNDLFKQVLIVWSIVGPILGGIIGFFAKRWHIRYQARHQSLVAVSDEFRSIFAKIINQLEQADIAKGDSTQFVIDSNARQSKAVAAEFKLALKSGKRNKFEIALANFINHNYDPRKTQYSEEDMKKLAFKNINKLFEFSKY